MSFDSETLEHVAAGIYIVTVRHRLKGGTLCLDIGIKHSAMKTFPLPATPKQHLRIATPKKYMGREERRKASQTENPQFLAARLYIPSARCCFSHNIFRNMSTRDCNSKIVRLSVGGTRYDVARDTLERCGGSMLAKLISGHWKEGKSDEPIFIDRNGRLFEYVLDYLRNNKFHLPPSVCRATVKEEFEYYGIAEGIRCETEKYDNTFFFETAEQLVAERNELAAMNAAKESAQLVKEVQSAKQELVFFLMIEYYKIKPSPGRSVMIDIPLKYRQDCRSPLMLDALRRRGFVVLDSPSPDEIMTIRRKPKSDKKS